MKHITTISLVMVLIISLPLWASDIHDAVSQGDLNTVQNLVNNNPELLLEKDANGCTPLHVAAINGQVNIAEFLLSKGVPVDVGDNENSTPLDLAATNGQLAVVEFLISKGAEVNHKDINNMCPILWAASRGNSDIFQFLLTKGADIRARDNQGMTTLHYAVYRRHLDLARFLVEKGLEVNAQKVNGSTPLHGAALNGDMDMVTFLISKGADIHIKNEAGFTPFLTAVTGCQKSTAEYLLSKGANPNAVLNTGESALIQAITYCRDNELATWLVENGADVNAVTTHAITPLLVAIFRENVDVVDLLVRKGANVNITMEDGVTPLLASISNGSIDIAEILIKNGAEVNAKDSRGNTVLMLAAKKGEDNIVAMLLAKGAKINVKDRDYGRTALHYAAIKGRVGAADILIKNGAEVNATDKKGNTALNMAAQYGHQDVVQLLMSQGGIAKGKVEYNFGRSAQLDKELVEKQAIIWYLGHCGYAVKTKNHFLIFDYWEHNAPPAHPCLANGYINPAELAGRNVTVFVSHEHIDHFDTTIFGWANAMNNVTYIYGFRPEALPQYLETGYPGPEYQYLGPRSEMTVDGMEIVTIDANDAGVGFLVKVDGLTLYHAGDHAGWLEGERQGYTREIDYLTTKTRQVDIAFLNVTGCHAHGEQQLWEGTCYSIDKLKPRLFIPTHGVDREWVYKDYQDRLQREKGGVTMFCPENGGDRYFYSD